MKVNTLFLAVVLVIFGCSILSLPPGVSQSKGPTLLMVISPADAQKKEAIERIHSYYDARGISFETALTSDFSNAEALKDSLRARYQKEGISNLILPLRSFQSRITVNIHGTEHELLSDFYFANLDGDPHWTSEISVARTSVDEMEAIAKRANAPEVQMDFAFPMINYLRAQGKCWVYHEVDPSQMGADLKKQVQNQGYKAVSYFESEGDRSCGQKPDFSLQEETIAQASGNVSFYLSTIEVLNPDAEGNAEIQRYPQFMRAILHDKNKSGTVDPGEVEVKKYYSYSSQTTDIHRIGLMPLFDNSQLNLNQFSSIISHEYPGKAPIFFGQGSGMTASYLAVLRLVAENLIAGKSVGKSIEVYQRYKEKFPLDLYNQELFALSLFVRGDPSLSLGELVSAPKIEIDAPEELHFGLSPLKVVTINNRGNSPLEWEISEHPSWLWAIPRSGSILPGKQQSIGLVSIPAWLSKRKEGIITIKSNDPLQPEIHLKVSRERGY